MRPSKYAEAQTEYIYFFTCRLFCLNCHTTSSAWNAQWNIVEFICICSSLICAMFTDFVHKGFLSKVHVLLESVFSLALVIPYNLALHRMKVFFLFSGYKVYKNSCQCITHCPLSFIDPSVWSYKYQPQLAALRSSVKIKLINKDCFLNTLIK